MKYLAQGVGVATAAFAFEMLEVRLLPRIQSSKFLLLEPLITEAGPFRTQSSHEAISLRRFRAKIGQLETF